MRRKKLNKLSILIYIVILAIGFLIGKTSTFQHYFEIENKINIIDVFSVLATLAAAYWIAKVLDKEKEDFRESKNLILRRSSEINDSVVEFVNLCRNTSFPLNDITATIKRISLSLTSIQEILKTEGLTTDDVLLNKIRNLLRDLSVLLTFTPYQQPVNAIVPITINNGIITITPFRLNEVEIKFEEIKNNLLRYELFINKL